MNENSRTEFLDGTLMEYFPSASVMAPTEELSTRTTDAPMIGPKESLTVPVTMMFCATAFSDRSIKTDISRALFMFVYFGWLLNGLLV